MQTQTNGPALHKLNSYYRALTGRIVNKYICIKKNKNSIIKEFTFENEWKPVRNDKI